MNIQAPLAASIQAIRAGEAEAVLFDVMGGALMVGNYSTIVARPFACVRADHFNIIVSHPVRLIAFLMRPCRGERRERRFLSEQGHGYHVSGPVECMCGPDRRASMLCSGVRHSPEIFMRPICPIDLPNH